MLYYKLNKYSLKKENISNLWFTMLCGIKKKWKEKIIDGIGIIN